MTAFSFRFPAIIALTGIVAGTILGRYAALNMPVVTVIFIAALLLLIMTYFRLDTRYFSASLILFLLIGSYLMASQKYQYFAADDVGQYASSSSSLRCFGKIEKWPVLKQHKTILTCRVDSIIVQDSVRPASGSILINVQRETTEFMLGDEISFSGRLYIPSGGNYPGQFDYREYLENKGIRAVVYMSNPALILKFEKESNIWGKIISSLRKWTLDCFQSNLTEIPYALASGFLIGETRDIPEDIYQAFRRTGTLHLLAVSGSNVALVLIVFSVFLKIFSFKKITRLLILILVIVVFSHLSHNQPSVIRASVMAILIILARFLYRRANLNNIIAAAACLLILYDPANLFDIGFQLSFAVTWGLISFLPKINSLLTGKSIPSVYRYLLLIALGSFIASLVSAPITLYYFGEMSLVTVFSNLVIVPMVSAAVIGIMILLAVNLIFPPLTLIPGVFLDRLLSLINDLVIWFGSWEFSSIRTAEVRGEYSIFALVILTMLFFAITSKAFRRLLVFSILLGGICFFGEGLLARGKPISSIEIYNWGAAQSIIINSSNAVAIYHQSRVSRYDDFGSNLIPYLIDREESLPEIYILFEPKHRTMQRMAEGAEFGPEIDLYPVNDFDFSNPSIWTNTEKKRVFENETYNEIQIGHNVVIINILDSIEIIIANSPVDFNRLPENIIEQCNWYIIFVNSDKNLAELAAVNDMEKAIILLEKHKNIYKILQDNNFDELYPGLNDKITLPGSNITLIP
ncbi:MAG: ComEC/Rec2 family competence protein [Candidatus Zixiibacteriota bacterium]